MAAATLSIHNRVDREQQIPRSDTLTSFQPVLNRLRFLAQGCRISCRLDISEACAIVHADKHKSLDAVATAIIRVLSQAVNGHMTFLSPGSHQMSFDEKWLVRVLDRAAARDTISVEFLLRSRVCRHHHHAFRSLIRAVAPLL